MVRAQGMIPQKWIVTCVCLLLTIYFYRQKQKNLGWYSRRRPPHRASRNPEKGVVENGGYSDALPAKFETFDKGLNSRIYNPYPDYNSDKWSEKWKGHQFPCRGPRGLDVNGVADDMLIAYHPSPEDSRNQPIFGTFQDTGLDPITCFSASTRYGPYGYREEGDEVLPSATAPSEVVWEHVNWGDLQKRCIARNRDRFEDVEPVNQSTVFRYPGSSDIMNVDDSLYFPTDTHLSGKTRKPQPRYKKRTAIVFNVAESKEWTLDTTQYVRSMIMELSLHTGGEYEVVVLVEVKDDGEPIFNNRGVYKKILERSVPREFQGISHLYNRKLLTHWYSKTQTTNIEDQPAQTYKPLQLISLARPDIEFFWQMDVDARYTGHHYDHLETISAWSKGRPRDLMWELASQVYMQDVHGTWNDFVAKVRKFAKKATVRGPLRTTGIEPVGPDPPLIVQGKDRWGVGEEADLITFGPVFNPASSSFRAGREVENYPDGVDGTPRRATPISTMTRTSKRLLRAMHHGQVTLGTHMSPTMFPASTAMHHGLKVIAFPLPIFLDATIPPEAFDKEWNANWGSKTYDFPFRFAHPWKRMTFSVAIDQASMYGDEIYKRWLGYDGNHTQSLCLPGMLLHPVRGV